MKRKHKKYERPRKLYDSVRIREENKLVEKYGLKNKREIWKTEARVRYLRTRAKLLIRSSEDEQQKFFAKLSRLGLSINSIADVLALTKEDLLKRRLSTVLVSRGIAVTPKAGRQMITHKRVMIKSGIVSAPGYIVSVDEEPHIVVKGYVKPAKQEKAEDE